jgi:hypothetical protein
MIPFLLAAVGGYLIGDSMKDIQIFADGGMTGKLKNYTVTGIYYWFDKYANYDEVVFYEKVKAISKYAAEYEAIKKIMQENEGHIIESEIDIVDVVEEGIMAKGGKIKGKLIHKVYGVEYYQDDSLIEPTSNEKLFWELNELPDNIEKKEQYFETVIDEYSGKSKKEVAQYFDENLKNGKYDYVGHNPDLYTSFD